MRTLILCLFTITFITHLNAKEYGSKINQWKILSGDNHYYIQKHDSKTKILKILSIGGKPKLDKIITKKESPNLIYVIYQAGTAGTSQIVSAYRAVIYDPEKNNFLGDVAYKYVNQKANTVYQPNWKFNNGKLTVEDESYNTKVTISLE